MRRWHGRVREHGLMIRAVSGATILSAIVAVASASDNISALRTLKDWIWTHPAVAIGVLAAVILLDDLFVRFTRHGSDAERGRHRAREEQRVKYLAFISASSGEESFYSQIFNHLVQAARSLSDADTRLLVIPWFPKAG